MKINGIDISSYKAKLLDRVIFTNNIDSTIDWMDQATEGILLNQTRDWRDINLTLLIKETNEDIAYRTISTLTEALKECSLRFDDIDLDFPCILNGSFEPERLQNGTFKITYQLKNNVALDSNGATSVEFGITVRDGRRINLKYIRSWLGTMEGYYVCFDADEITQDVGSDTIYVDTSNVDAIINKATSWEQLFLALGADLNKFKSENELNGKIQTDLTYTKANAKNLLTSISEITVLYDRYHADGYPDMPDPGDYPSLAWDTGTGNTHFIDTNFGMGYNIQDISVIVTGRWYYPNPSSNGCMIGAYDDEYYAFWQHDAWLYCRTGGTKAQNYVVYSQPDDVMGQYPMYITGTEEIVSMVPLRDYGYLSSLSGKVNVVFNDYIITTQTCGDHILDDNITIGYGSLGKRSVDNRYAQNCDIARVQIFYKNDLVKDLILIDEGNLRNCFINKHGAGMFDLVNMTYVSFGENGDGGYSSSALMTIPKRP